MAVGILRMAPSEFYKISLKEFWAAFEAWCDSKGLNSDNEEDNHMSRERFFELAAMYRDV